LEIEKPQFKPYNDIVDDDGDNDDQEDNYNEAQEFV